MLKSIVTFVALLVMLGACGSGTLAPFDAGSEGDAGTTDAGSADSGPPDAGATDAGTTDAGAIDAGVPDAGPVGPG